MNSLLSTMPLIVPPPIGPGDTIGVFTPSYPGYSANEGLFTNGIRVLETLGFKVRLGRLTQARKTDGQRSGTASERAAELMELISDPEVKGLIATIGGMTSASLVPYLDFDAIRANPKFFIGYSDVTSLHLAFLVKARVATWYGPGLMTWIGDWPGGEPQSIAEFVQASKGYSVRRLEPPPHWSRHFRRWDNGDWSLIPRDYEPNQGWRTVVAGKADGPLLAANLNTLVAAAGTDHFPDLRNVVLFVENRSDEYDVLERCLRHLQLIGALDAISGLVISKFEVVSRNSTDEKLDRLLLEIVGRRDIPVVADFDCGHTVPMLPLPQLGRAVLEAHRELNVTLTVMPPSGI